MNTFTQNEKATVSIFAAVMAGVWCFNALTMAGVL